MLHTNINVSNFSVYLLCNTLAEMLTPKYIGKNILRVNKLRPTQKNNPVPITDASDYSVIIYEKMGMCTVNVSSL